MSNVDKLLLMRAFSEVVSQGGFSKAADKLGVSAQLVSKYVGQLEANLDTRLLNRTTRRVAVTEVGQAYYERCVNVLREVDAMEANVQALQSTVAGTLRVNAPMSFGVLHLSTALVEFQKRHCHLSVNLQLNDRKVDIVDEGYDLALRIGHLKSSNLVAKKLARVRLICCASPDYIKQNGRPESPLDLAQHSYLKYSNVSDDLVFGSKGVSFSPEQKPMVKLESNNGDALVNAAKRGLGFIVQPSFIVGDAIRSGELHPLLESYEPTPMGLYAVYAHRQYLSPKVRAFIDFMSEYFGQTPYWDEGLR